MLFRSAWLLSEAINEEIRYVGSHADAEVVFTSVFGSESIPREKNISIIGENIRPNFALCSYSLSFDLDTYGGKIVMRRSGMQEFAGQMRIVSLLQTSS